MSIFVASKQYNIPYRKLYNRYNGKHCYKPGGQPIFSNAEEKSIFATVTKCGNWGFVTRLEW